MPVVAVLVVARHEPAAIMEKTLAAAAAIRYPSKKLYLLDDSTLEEFKQAADAVAQKYGATVFRREQRHGDKAGILNDAFNLLDEKYVALLDVDERPSSDFLDKTVSLLERDGRLAFVQLPQFYENSLATPVAQAAEASHSLFYGGCEGKNTDNAMPCCGSNTVMRLEAIKSVGGFSEDNVTEDFATSFKLHKAGWRSLYLNERLVCGLGPETFAAYVCQRKRLSGGKVGVLRDIIISLLREPSALSAAQWREYLLSGSIYLVNWVFFLFVLLPPLWLATGRPVIFASVQVYAVLLLPCIGVGILVILALGKNGYRAASIWKSLVLGYLSFPALLLPSWAGFLGVRQEFGITRKGDDSSCLTGMALWPWLVLLALNIGVLLWAALARRGAATPAVYCAAIWCLIQTLLLSSVFYFNKTGKAVGS